MSYDQGTVLRTFNHTLAGFFNRLPLKLARHFHMLYYQFSVAPTLDSADLYQLGHGMASVMVRCDDVNEGTTRVLKHLAAEHWEVIEVRNARMAESAEEFGYDQRLLRLYEEAEKNGIACLLIAPRSGKILPPEEVPTM